MWHVITNQDAQSNDDQNLIAYFCQARYSVLNLKYQSIIKIIKQQKSYIVVKVYEASTVISGFINQANCRESHFAIFEKNTPYAMMFQNVFEWKIYFG